MKGRLSFLLRSRSLKALSFIVNNQLLFLHSTICLPEGNPYHCATYTSIFSQKNILLLRRGTFLQHLIFIVNTNFYRAQFVCQKETITITIHLYSHRRKSFLQHLSLIVDNNFYGAQLVCQKKILL